GEDDDQDEDALQRDHRRKRFASERLQNPVCKRAEDPGMEQDDRGRDQEQNREAQRLALEVRVVDEEVGGDRDRRGGRYRLFGGDACQRYPARDAGALGEQQAPEHVEDASGDVAGKERLAPYDLGPPRPDPVAEEAQDQVPAERAQRVVDQQDDDRRGQP